MTAVTVSFRVELGPGRAIGPGKVALLENIDRNGSLSQAARTLRMSYRRAWLLLEDLNTSFQQPVALLSVGGRGGGGASLTPFGADVVRAYRELEARICTLAQSAFPDDAVPPADGPIRHRSVARRRMNRKSAASRQLRTKR
jgi:molybdate transport system regulatory protein